MQDVVYFVAEAEAVIHLHSHSKELELKMPVPIFPGIRSFIHSFIYSVSSQNGIYL